MKLSRPVEQAAARLHAARPDALIIMFGSQARGDARPDSDVDFLVIQSEVNEFVPEAFAGNPEAADETFGFHAQQAAEKLVKAALAARGVVYPRTHRLGDLLDLARDRGVALPVEFDHLHELTPFAVEYRYEFYAEEVDQPLDRAPGFPTRPARHRDNGGPDNASAGSGVHGAANRPAAKRVANSAHCSRRPLPQFLELEIAKLDAVTLPLDADLALR